MSSHTGSSGGGGGGDDPESVFRAAEASYDDAHKASLLAACAALGLAATSKREAFDALKAHFVHGPADAARGAKDAVRAAAHAVFARARAEFDDVEKEELLEACAALGLLVGGAGSKRDAYALLEAAFVRRAHCVAKLEHKGEGGVYALAVVEGAGLISGGETFICAWSQGADRGLKSIAGRARGIAALPGGRFATAEGRRTKNLTVDVWDAGTMRQVNWLRGHTESVQCVAAFPGGLLASGSGDKSVRIWSGAGDKATLVWHDVNALAALPDGRLASGSDDKTIRLWNVATRACTKVLQHPDCVHALAVLDCGRLASGCSDKRVYIWSLAGGVQEAALEGHTDWVLSLAALPNGLLASGGRDKTVRVWDVGARACVAVLEGHEGTVNVLAALPDGRLASCSYSNSLIRVWALAAPGTPEDAAAAAAAAAARGVVVAPGKEAEPAEVAGGGGEEI